MRGPALKRSILGACRRRPAGLVLACLAALTAAVVFRDAPPAAAQGPQLPQGTRVLRNLAYVPGGHERQKLDLYLPAGSAPVPVVVWIHGGGWEGGSKDNPGALGLLWQGGFALASINYRLSPHAPFPAQLEDCKSAVRWLRANAVQHRIDGSRIGVWGQSAGGHLAALVGTTGDAREFDRGPNAQVSSRVQAVVDYFGPTDLGLYGGSRPGDTLSRLIGGPIQENRERVAQANPITYVRRGVPPFFIAHGDQDTLVPLEHSRRLEAALRRAGGDVTLHVVPGAGHSLGGTEMNRRVGAFLARHLGQTAH